MNKEVVRAPNGRVITNTAIVNRYASKYSLKNTSGECVSANHKSLTSLPEDSIKLDKVEFYTLLEKVDYLVGYQGDPCFIEIVRIELLRDFGYAPDIDWLGKIGLKIKSLSEVVLYYLAFKYLSISMKHSFVHKFDISFKLASRVIDLDKRKINALKNTLDGYLQEDGSIQLILDYSNDADAKVLKVFVENKSFVINVSEATALANLNNLYLTKKLFEAYMSDQLYKSGITISLGNLVILNLILFLIVVTSSEEFRIVG